MGINIIKQTGTANTTSSPGRKIQYIAIHYTAGTSSTTGNARANASWFTNPSAKASADFVVDDTQIVQVNPDPRNRYCWAVGGREYGKYGGSLYGVAKNANTISIEICSNNKLKKMTYPNDPNYYFTDAAVANAVKLTQYLMKEYGIDANHVVRHYDISAKLCPGIIGWNKDSGDDSKWTEFKKKIGGSYKEPVWYRVRKSWVDSSSQIGAYQKLENAKDNCPYGYHVFDEKGNIIFTPEAKSLKTLTAKDLTGSEAQKIVIVAPIYQEVMKETGMLASVGLAQFCLESGYGTTDLAQNANNMHGMKCSLSGNTWANSVWDGVSKYGKYSPEVYNGVTQSVYSEFRKYPSIYKSVQDRAAYFIGAWLDAAKTKHRYPNVNMIKDAQTQVKLLKSGGYATDPNYVSKLLNIISRFNLTQYDKGINPNVWDGKSSSSSSTSPTPTTSPVPTPSNVSTSTPVQQSQKYYRVGKSFDGKSVVGQVGAYTIRENAIDKATQTGLIVFDPDYKPVFWGIKPADKLDKKYSKAYTIKTQAKLRSGPGTDYRAIDVLPVGSSVNCYGYYSVSSKGAIWYYVVYKGKVGYVISSRVR